ncbi:MAG: TonB-dependent receptor [Oleiphilaceae bacterium]|nr:TonB-dependent receptor [Oleiphilaceae bacterium]
MKRFSRAACQLLALTAISTTATAEDLSLYVFGEDGPVTDVQLQVDGTDTPMDADGQWDMELTQGSYRFTLLRDGEALERFRVDMGQGQNADVSVRLNDDGEAEVNIETYDPRESISDREGEPQGVLEGQITTLETGSPLAGARISVPDSDYAATTDSNGNFRLSLPRGLYDLSITHPEYGNITAESVRVVANVTRNTGFNLSASTDGSQLEQVTAVASYQPDTVSEQQRTAESVLDVIGSEQLARFGDSNAADATRRSVGVNVAEGKFVFVRGLGGRYTTTTLNGAQMPSTDPSRRTTPLDLFPAGVLEQVNVQKGFTPDQPGDSSAGNVQLLTRSFPEEDFTKLSLSLGGNTRITGDTVTTDQADSSRGFIGFDDGAREMPRSVRSATDFGQNNNLDSLSDSEVEALGEAFPQTLDGQRESVGPDLGFGVTGGREVSRGNNVYGFYGAFSYSNSWDVKDEGVENTYAASSNGLVLKDETEFFESENNVDLSAMVAVGAEFGINHSLEATTLLSRKTESTVRRTQGFTAENGVNIDRFEYDYEERQFFTQQFAGEHFFSEYNDLTANWQYTFSRADRYAPDRRTVAFDDRNSNNGDLVFSSGDFQRRYDDLSDENHDASLDLKFPLINTGDVMADVKTGLAFVRRDRESRTARFRYTFAGSRSEENAIINGNPPPSANEVLSPENINANEYVLINQTNPSDRYEGSLDVNAFYLMADADLYQDFRLVGGARVEQAKQEVDTVDGNNQATTAGFDETDVLPSLNLTWFMNPDMQVRAGVSQTVARPDFKEQASATFFDPTFGFTVLGNPDLETSSVNNFDIRWEWYPSQTESLTIGAFYKDLDSPIERVILQGGGSGNNSRRFENAESGEIQGVEVDYRREFALDDALSQTVFLQANASLIDSEVTLQSGTGEANRTRPLQGQADSTLNIAVGYDHFDSGQKVTLLFNRNGESIEDAGIGVLPSVIKQPINQVDLTYEKTFTTAFTMDVKVENLLDEETAFTQGGEPLFRFKPGISVQLGADYRF